MSKSTYTINEAGTKITVNPEELKESQEKTLEFLKSVAVSKSQVYWIEVNPDTGKPENNHGGICFATYPGDTPANGFWIKVKSIGEDNQSE